MRSPASSCQAHSIDPTRGHRILVIGTSCTGKTTFSRRLGAALQTPVVELDELHWAENWQERPRNEFQRLVEEATSGPAWIADGNYGAIRDVLWPRATLVVWLNYSFPCVLWRGVRRSVQRSLRGTTLWHGNRESLRRTFLSRDSILLWIITTHARRREEFSQLRTSGRFPQLQWVEFTRPTETEGWLQGVLANAGSDSETGGCV